MQRQYSSIPLSAPCQANPLRIRKYLGESKLSKRKNITSSGENNIETFSPSNIKDS